MLRSPPETRDGNAPESLKTVVTYLEQTARPKLFVPMPVNLQVALMQQTEMPLHFYSPR